MSKKKLWGGAALAAFSLAAMAPPAIAQQTTAAVRGAISSANGPVANATVTVTHVPTGQVTTTSSNGAGVFDVRGLRVGGPYKVSVRAPNYTPQDLDGVYLSLGDASGLNVVLEPEVAAVVVTATRAPQTRLADPGTRTTMGREEIASVVTTRRDIRDLTRRDPLVTIDNVTRGTGPAGGIYIAGSTPRLNRITIDGVKSADDFGLNTGGLSTTRGPISIEAIEQLTVQAVPFDVSEGDFTGGAVNIVLRGGENDFHGSVFDNYQNDGLVGKRYNNAQQPLTVHLENYGGFLSGPLWKDRAFFAVAGEYYDSLDPNAFGGPTDLGYTSTINGLAGSAGPKLTTADLAPVLAAYNTYAVSAAQNFGGFPRITPTTDIKRSIRTDFNITNNQRLQATFRHAESSLYKAAGGGTLISPVSNWYVQGELEDNYGLQLNSRWTKAFSTEARVSYRSYVRHQEPPQGQQFSLTQVCMEATASGDPFTCQNTNTDNRSGANVTPNGEPIFNVGPDQFRQANLLKTQNLSTDFVGTYALERHLLKAGFQSKDIDIYNLFVTQGRGVFYFDSVADFNAGKASRLQFNNNPSGNLNDAAADFAYGQRSLFVQDSWDVTDALTLNYGVRYDYYESSDKPALNTRFQTRYGFTNQTTYDGLDVVMPRLSFKYEPAERFSLSGGVGIFSGGLPDVFLSNSFGNTGVLAYAVDLQRLGDGTFRDGGSNAVIDPVLANQLLTINKSTYGRGVPLAANVLLNPNTAAGRTATTNSLAPNFEMPSDYKANLSAKWEVGDGWNLGFDFVGTRSDVSLAFRDIRARRLTINGVQQYTPDGRIRYDGLNITSANRTTAGLPVSTDADLINLGGSTDLQAFNPGTKSWSNTYAFSVGKTFEKHGLDMNLAYVHQDAENFGALSEFSTTAGGFYNDQFSSYDPNTSVSGIASNRIKDQFKATIGWEHQFVGDLKSRFTLFGEVRSGRPFSFLMTESGRGPVFGVNRQDQLLYVPDINNPAAGNALKFVSPTANALTGAPVTVFFADQATLDGFKTVVNRFGLPVNAITGKGSGENPEIHQLDFQYSQELPTFFQDHKMLFTVDVKNVLNLINENWGLVREFGDSRGGTGNRVVTVQCADPTTGAAVANTSAACGAYRYSAFNSGSGTVGEVNGRGNIDTSSRWYVQLGLKYQF